MWLTCLAPKKFLCRYDLNLGANIFGTLITCVNIACIMGITIEIIGFGKCTSCSQSVLRSAYGFSGTAVIYCVIVVFVQLWYLWGIREKKSSVVLMWVVVTSMWLAQTFCLTVVHLFMYMTDASFATRFVSVIFALIAFGIAAYGVAVGFGLWFELKSLSTRRNSQSINN